MMKKSLNKTLWRAAYLFAVTAAVSTVSADIVLHPGYLTGSFTIGNYNVHSANVSASGDGYSASKSITGDSYTLTVEGGDWDYAVNANAFIRPVDVYYPYTRMYFNTRSIQVPVGATVPNDYAFPEAATIRYQIDITGDDTYSDWVAWGYALENVAPADGERTYSQSYTTSQYSPLGEWDMPVVPNGNVRIWATVRVRNVIEGRSYYTYYNFWMTPAEYLYQSIAGNQVLPIPLAINHVAPIPDIQEDPQYDYGSINGTVELTSPDQGAFFRHRVNAYGRRYYYQNLPLNTNPAPYEFASVQTDDLEPYSYNLRALSWFDNSQTYLTWPCEQGDCANNQLVVQANQNNLKNFFSDTGILTGALKFSGTLADQALTSYTLSADTRQYYDPVFGWIYPPTYGGSAQHTKSGSNVDGSYRLFGQEGPWLPWRVNAYKNEILTDYRSYFSLIINDYRHYYDGSTYNFGSPTDLVAGVTLVEDREYCTGSVVVRYRDESGGLLSYPSLNGYGYRYTETGARELYVTMNGSLTVRNALEPTIELHGLAAEYNLRNIRFQTEDGTYLTFPGFPITLECGVRKGVPVSGKPIIVVEQPPAYYLTNATSLTVLGTAADDTGIASMTIDGDPITFELTGNPENEVSFGTDVAVQNGTNMIITTATDLDGNESFDERPVYVDGWVPSVSIVSPNAALILPDTQTTVPLEVTASDQGYGFDLQVTLNGEVVCEAAGSGNQTVAETIACNAVIGPFDFGSSTIEAIARDAAGNQHSASTTITLNTTPTVDAGIDTSLECGATFASTGSFTDPGMDTWTATVDYGDGSGVETLALNADNTFTLNHDYAGTGVFTVTVTVTDNHGEFGVDTAVVTSSDTIAPTITAELTPHGDGDEPDDDDEGRFIVSFSVIDSCGAVTTTEAVFLIPGWLTPIAVENGQLIEFEIEDEADDVEIEWEYEGGVSILEIEASALTLQVTATDSEGNSAVTEAVPTGLASDNDDHDEQD